MIVEDERIVAYAMDQSLHQMGYDVTGISASSTDALEQARRDQPDLALMDIRIKSPRDGIGVAAEIREQYGIPSIYITAHADDATVARAKLTEPLGFLVKPFSKDELRACIEVGMFRHRNANARDDSQEVREPNPELRKAFMGSLDFERGRYRLDNALAISGIVREELTSRLSRYFDSETVAELSIGLAEMLMNAVEHGNLEIDFDEKTGELSTGDYLTFLLDRADSLPYKDRPVILEYSIGPRAALFRIRDFGKGFDPDTQQAGTKQGGLLPHGRGIALARTLFDIVKFNSTGNIVTLVKYADAVKA